MALVPPISGLAWTHPITCLTVLPVSVLTLLSFLFRTTRGTTEEAVAQSCFPPCARCETRLARLAPLSSWSSLCCSRTLSAVSLSSHPLKCVFNLSDPIPSPMTHVPSLFATFPFPASFHREQRPRPHFNLSRRSSTFTFIFHHSTFQAPCQPAHIPIALDIHCPDLTTFFKRASHKAQQSTSDPLSPQPLGHSKPHELQFSGHYLQMHTS